MEPVRIEFVMAGDLNKGIAQVRNSVQGLDKDVAKTYSGIESMGKRVGGLIAGYLSFNAAQSLVSSLIQVRGEFQKLDISLQTILGNKKEADALFAQVVELAAKTPFQLTEVGQATKQLLAYKVSSDEVIDVTRRLGDVSAGLSIPLNDLIYLYGTTRIQNRLYTRDLIQFTGRGIDLTSSLAKQFGVTDEKVRSLVESGKVGFENVKVAIEEMTNAGGSFYNLMEKQSSTVTGQLSNLKDAWEVLLNTIGEANEGVLFGSISGLKSLIENYEDVLHILKVIIITYGTYRAALIATAAAQGGLAVASLKFTSIIARLVNGIRILNVTMAANPAAAVATALFALTSTLILFRKELFSTADAQKRFNDFQEESKKQFEDEIKKIEDWITVATDQKQLLVDRENALKSLQQYAKGNLDNLTLETIATAKGTEAIEKFTKAKRLQLEQERLSNQEIELRKRIETLSEPVPKNRRYQSQFQGTDYLSTRDNSLSITKAQEDLEENLARQKELNKEQDKQIDEATKAQIASIEYFQQQIKALQDKQNQEATNATQFKQYQQEIYALEEKIRGITGELSKVQQSRIEGYARVREELAGINEDIRIASLSGNDQEIEQAKTKYAELLVLAKGNTALLAEIELTRDNEIAALRKRQKDKADEEDQKRQKDAYDELYERTKSYQQRLLDLEKKYLAERNKLTTKGELGNVAVLDAQYQQQREDIAREIAAQNEMVELLFGDIEQLGKDAVRDIITQVNALIDNILEPVAGKNSKVVQELRKQIQAIQNDIGDGFLGNTIASLSEVLRSAGDATFKISANFSISIQQISRLLDDVNTIIDSKANTSAKVGSIVSAVSFVITSARDAMLSAADVATEMDSQVEDHKIITSQIAAQNLLLERQKTLLEDLRGVERVEATFAQIKSFEDSRKEALEQLKQAQIDVIKSQEEVGIDPLFGNQPKIKGFGGFLINALTLGQAKTKIKYEFESVDTSGLDDIEDFIRLRAEIAENGGKIGGKEVVQADIDTLDALIQKYQEAEAAAKQYAEIYKQILTGTTEASIADSIIEGFRAGKRGAEDFADDFEKLMQNAILSALKYQVLEEPLQKFYEQFAAYTESNGELSSFEVARLQYEYDKIILNAERSFENLKKVSNIGFESSELDKGLSGGIERQLTEDTGKEIVGIFNGMRIQMSALNTTADRQLDRMTKNMLHLARIEQNTEYCRKLESIDNRLGRLETDGMKIR
ncbi:MAG: hypothetical protein HC819_14820 [Cyclobacteriaceae bacterium]|nr:hypothetical protein [Cyclobacteriaceae bacterium]